MPSSILPRFALDAFLILLLLFPVTVPGAAAAQRCCCGAAVLQDRQLPAALVGDVHGGHDTPRPAPTRLTP